MALADIVRNLYGGRFQGLPQDLNRSFGRQSIYTLAQSLMSNPTLMGGLAGGIQGGEKIFDVGNQQFIEQDRKQKEHESEMLNEQLSRERTEQLMGLAMKAEERAVSAEDRAMEDQSLQAESHGWQKTDRERKIATGSQMAEAFADSPEEIALYTAMADSGQFNELFDSIMERKFPAVEHWGDPFTKPGVGLMQENKRTGEIRVLHHEPRENGSGFGAWSGPQDMPGVGTVQINNKTGRIDILSKEGQGKQGKQYTPNPQQIGKLKVDILEKQLIPTYLKGKKPKGILDTIASALGRGEQEKPQGEMTMWGPYEIPKSLILKAEESAVRQHVETYRKAAAAVGQGVKAAPVIGSLSAGPVKGAPLQDFSSKIALENAVRNKVNSDPAYAQMPEDQKKQVIEQIVAEARSMIESGEGTYEEAIEMFLGGQ